MIASYNELRYLVASGAIKGVSEGAINGSSIDVHLGEHVRVESTQRSFKPIRLAARERIRTDLLRIGPSGVTILPRQFFLAHTVETFDLPANYSMEFKLKSTLARNGVQHMLATWADPGWVDSSMTLEIVNNTEFHHLLFEAGMPIGQVIFHRHEPVPPEHMYSVRGRYNHDRIVSEAKD